MVTNFYFIFFFQIRRIDRLIPQVDGEDVLCNSPKTLHRSHLQCCKGLLRYVLGPMDQHYQN